MSNRSGFVKAAALAAALCAPAFAADPATQANDTAQEIKALRARLDQLEAQQKESEQKRQEAERKFEETTTSEQLMQDAKSRDNFMAVEGFTAGFTDNRFIIQSADGNFVFRPWIHFQPRYIVNDRQSFKKGGDDDVEQGFEIRRMRFGFDGNLFTPDFTYFFNWSTVRASSTVNVTNSAGATVGTVSNNLGGTPLLEEAWVKYKLPGSDFYLKGGQIKDPVLHDQIVSTRYQQSAERSITADIFINGDAFTEGATVIWDPNGVIRTEGGVTHGMRAANTNFLDFPNTNAFDYGLVGRVEYKVMGQWKDYNQMGAVGVKEPLLVFGGGIDYSERGHAGQTVGVLDAVFAEERGFNVYGAVVDRYTTHNFGIYTQSPTGANIGTPNPAVANHATNEYSLLLQGGYKFDQHWEPFGRYEYMRLQGTVAGSRNYVQVLTGGVNYYFYGHRAKLTAQAAYLPNGIPIDDTPNDVLTNGDGHGEFVFIAQFQLLL
ncbi:MAG: phosphate-selective porin family protein [Phycisphaerales bacterium]|nr:phosphate-selective porin family protein [Phycisphaerales bacterium]